MTMQILKRNVAGQKIYFRAFYIDSGNPVTGDASNITCYWSKDGNTPSLTTNGAVELSSSSMPGIYTVTLTAAEATASNGLLYPVSSTTNVRCELVTVSFLLSAFAWVRKS